MTRLDYSTRTWLTIFIWVLIHGKPLHTGEVGVYIHGVLVLYGCLISRVYSSCGGLPVGRRKTYRNHERRLVITPSVN